jgi:hypothetical protein
MKLLHIATACSRWARAFRDWYPRPDASELRGRKLLKEWLSPEQLAQYDAHNYFEVTGATPESDTGYATA